MPPTATNTTTHEDTATDLVREAYAFLTHFEIERARRGFGADSAREHSSPTTGTHAPRPCCWKTEVMSPTTITSEHGDDIRISASITEGVVVATVYDADVALSATARLSPAEAIAVGCELTQAALLALGEEPGESVKANMALSIEAAKEHQQRNRQQD